MLIKYRYGHIIEVVDSESQIMGGAVMTDRTGRKKNDSLVMRNVLVTAGISIATTLVSYLINHVGFEETNIVVIYILSVLMVSRYTNGYAYGIFAAVASMLSFNFFFTDPVYTFKVDDSSYFVTFFVMLMAAITTSALTSKLIYSKQLSDSRERQSRTLSVVTGALADTSEIQETAEVSARYLAGFLDSEVECYIKAGSMASLITAYPDGDIKRADELIGPSVIKDRMMNSYTFPIEVKGNNICYFRLPEEVEDLDEDNRQLVSSIIMQITISMERVLLIKEKEVARSEAEMERFKSNLLRAISHDLRTPLTRITGTSEMLAGKLKDKEDSELASEVYNDSLWLARLVENILSFTRVHEGNLSIKIQNEAVDEIFSEVVELCTRYYPNHKISIAVPERVLFVPMNGKLIVQVLINLIGNACEHTTPENEIKLTSWPEDGRVWFQVSDNGCGFIEDDIPKIFDMFFVSTNRRTSEKQGLGLGLAICKAIVEFHGGRIFAENNTSGGATVKFYLKGDGV
jgi:two-component system sensor histidine kinase KdpD